ncbi:hypothetical protein ARMGADRAFT_1062488 [Armillaria gallica]|uniref:Uncharacterized protein n=1 Tax=Armillaria gallica TaxID=47427 RepID=A0A2H3DIB8_ARMGA|nr:hypothetical protein ARMGADRAFT_1062488 [Armillaria gallica]
MLMNTEMTICHGRLPSSGLVSLFSQMTSVKKFFGGEEENNIKLSGNILVTFVDSIEEVPGSIKDRRLSYLDLNLAQNHAQQYWDASRYPRALAQAMLVMRSGQMPSVEAHISDISEDVGVTMTGWMRITGILFPSVFIEFAYIFNDIGDVDSDASMRTNDHRHDESGLKKRWVP